MEIDDVTYENFKNTLLALAKIPAKIIEQKAWEAHRLVKNRYTLDNYRETMYNHIKEIIKK